MVIRPSFRLAILFSCAVLSGAVPALAQYGPAQPQQPEKPFRALFGGNTADPRSRQALNFNFSFLGTYEDNDVVGPNADLVRQLSPLMTQTGFYWGGTTSVDYRRRWRRASFSAAGGTSTRLYRSLKELTFMNGWGSAAFSYAFGPRTNLSASQGVTYSPYFTNGWFPAMNPVIPGQPVTPGYSNYTFYRPNWQFNTGIDFLRRLTPKDSISGFGSLYYVNFLEKGGYPHATYYASQLSARYQHSLSRHFSLRAGYTYQKYRHGLIFVPDERTRGDNIDIGVDYQNTLRLGRRTTFGFSTGTAIVSYFSAFYYNLLIHAYIDTAMGRTWAANITYDRGFSFVEGLPAPYATDAVAAHIGGYLNRRTNLTFQGGYTHGTGVSTSEGRSYGTWIGIAQLQVAATEMLAIFGQGYLYHFNFKGSYPYSPLPTREWNRWGVRVGVTLWVPLLR